MDISKFDYSYPEELTAIEPLKDRDASRMMVLNRSSGTVEHSRIIDLPDLLKRGDLIVINDTKVFPARLLGKKESGGKLEIVLTKELPDGSWSCITNQTAKLKKGAKLIFDKGLVAEIKGREGDDIMIKFNAPELIEEVGLMPVPPYIRSKRPKGNDVLAVADRERYQTVYAKSSGSAAAPTAGLHFTDRLMKKIEAKGIGIARVTLHVGLDTFSPVRVDNILEHKMHGEEFNVPKETLDKIKETKASGGRVIAVGTTSVRALESHFQGLSALNTDLFIYPGYKFKVVDCILTNFHQPRSTLIMMISAFAGLEFVMKAYQEAIAKRYRLFSYGDCMLIV